VAHHITAVPVHAQATQVLARRDPTKVPAALADIEAAAADGLAAMRRVVGILRDPGDGRPDPAATAGPTTTAAPMAPALSEGLEDLVERFRRQGLPVRLRQSVAVADLPPDVTSTVYRVVREALTNVARPAPGATEVTVATHPAPQGVTVEVVNSVSPAPARRLHHPADRARTRRRSRDRVGTHQSGNRRRIVHLTEHRQEPRVDHPDQTRPPQPRRDRRLGLGEPPHREHL